MQAKRRVRMLTPKADISVEQQATRRKTESKHKMLDFLYLIIVPKGVKLNVETGDKSLRKQIL